MAVIAAALPATPASAAPANPPQLIDRIVAVVNNDVITLFELQDRLKTAIQQLKRQNTPLPPQEVLEAQMLERMIVDLVQVQFAKETGVRVDEIQLDRTIQRIAQDNRLSLEDFRRAVEKDGVSFAKFREEIRNEILIGRLREREVDNRVTVTDAEVDNFLGTRATQQSGQDEYLLAHILVRVPEQASPEQIKERRTRAERALAQLRAGVDFGQVAASFSDAPDALQGGVLGWRQSSRLPTLFLEAVAPMKAGEVTAPLRSPNGFHLLKVLDKRGNNVATVVQQTHARHILVKTNELVSETDAERRLNDLRERLANQGDFAALARLHSEDGSAAKGGDLGWLSPGDTVPEFERAMNALQPGEISKPVQSPFGWHLIQVLERREADVTRERERLMARQEIRARKADEAYEEWLRQLRDRAFVDNRLVEKY